MYISNISLVNSICWLFNFICRYIPLKQWVFDVPAPKPEKKSNIGMILVIFALAGAAGAAYYYIKFVKGRKPKDEDMDFFDDEGYEEEPYINEDDEPQIAEDAETDGDED